MRWVLVSLAGCGGIEAEVDYALARAGAECSQMERCEKGYFDATYPSQKDCVHDVKEVIGTSDDQYQQAQCDYDPAEAGRCVSRVRAMSCEDFVEGEEGNACDLVWNCSGPIFTYPPYYTQGRELTMRTVVVGALLVAGCGRPNEIPENEYAAATARATCARLQECSRGSFESSYFSMADCRAQLERTVSAQVDSSDQAGCDYDAKQAAYAYGQILDLSCEDFYKGKYLEDTVKIWDCHLGSTTFVGRSQGVGTKPRTRATGGLAWAARVRG